MSRMGEEMILALAASLNGDLNKTAAKKKEDGEDKEDKKDMKEDKKDEKEEKDEEKEEKKEKKDKKDKKASTLYIIDGLYKLATELDDMGEEEASSLVDDALRVIVQNIRDQESGE